MTQDGMDPRMGVLNVENRVVPGLLGDLLQVKIELRIPPSAEPKKIEKNKNENILAEELIKLTKSNS